MRAIRCTQSIRMDPRVELLASIATLHSGQLREFRCLAPISSIVLLYRAIVGGYVWASTFHHLNATVQLLNFPEQATRNANHLLVIMGPEGPGSMPGISANMPCRPYCSRSLLCFWSPRSYAAMRTCPSAACLGRTEATSHGPLWFAYTIGCQSLPRVC